MREALVFASQNQLDFQDIRTNVVRIPEVVMRIREAQKIWDGLELPALDIANFIASDDAIFLGHIRLKAFATAVIQVGLLDRYLKKNSMPEFVIGLTNGDSPMKVVTGEMTYSEMVNECAVHAIPRKLLVLNTNELPILAGVQLAKFSAYQRSSETGAFQILEADYTHIERLVETLAFNQQIDSLVVIGPGNSVIKSTDTLKVQDSIEIDAALSWFWQPSTLDLAAVN